MHTPILYMLSPGADPTPSLAQLVRPPANPVSRTFPCFPGARPLG